MKSLKFKIITVFITLFCAGCSDDECQYVQDDGFPYACTEGMDVAFLIDYTGSMGGAIEDIKSSVAAISSTIVTESGGDYRLSLSIFDEIEQGTDTSYSSAPDYLGLPFNQIIVNTSGPTTEQHLTMMEPFSAINTGSFTTQLNKLNGSIPLGYGVGGPEPGGLLLNEILNNNFANSWRTANLTKIAIIITDAVAGGNDDMATVIDDAFLSSLATSANSRGIQIILVTSLGTSNYEISLVDNNNLGLKLMNSDLNNVGGNIIQLIRQICIENNQ